jgi:flagellar motor switch protein FliG
MAEVEGAELAMQASMDDGRMAALLLMVVGEEEAAAILSRMEPDEVTKLGQAMMALTDVTEHHVAEMLDRFAE